METISQKNNKASKGIYTRLYDIDNWKRHKMKTNKTFNEISKLVEKLGELRNSIVVPLLMDPTRSIDKYTVSLMYERVREIQSMKNPPKNIDLLIHSGGGDADATFHIAIMFQEGVGKGKLTAIIPRWAKSAATLLACGCDKIALDLPSELGPIDPQIEDPSTGMWVSVSSIPTTIEFLKTIEAGPLLKEFAEKIPVMGFGDFERMKEHIEECLRELLLNRMFKEDEDAEDKVNNICTKLVKEYISTMERQ
jgi:hypothetical protein